jgi:hypothetical protein
MTLNDMNEIYHNQQKKLDHGVALHPMDEIDETKDSDENG